MEIRHDDINKKQESPPNIFHFYNVINMRSCFNEPKYSCWSVNHYGININNNNIISFFVY